MNENEFEFREKEKKIFYWHGFYEACRLLTTPALMDRPQLAVINEQRLKAKEELEELGVNFEFYASGDGAFLDKYVMSFKKT